MMLLEGERVCLRPFGWDDVEAVFAYASDPQVTRYVDWSPHRSLRESAHYVQQCMDNREGFLTLAIEHREQGHVIGAIDLRVISRLWRIGEIGYTVARAYWGQGYNVESGRLAIDYGFRDLGLRRIQAVCDVANRRSYRTMEKLGMVREMILYRARFDGQRPIDRYRYSIRRREWERHPLYRGTEQVTSEVTYVG
jgi:ribosomal-protein-alanine N-acetyltransferase